MTIYFQIKNKIAKRLNYRKMKISILKLNKKAIYFIAFQMIFKNKLMINGM